MNLERARDKYQKVSAAILAQMEQGSIPWDKPWNVVGGPPTNFLTGDPYQGTNSVILSMLGYDTPHFLTYDQAQQMGGQVRRGERGIPLLRVGNFVSKEERLRAESEGKHPTGRKYLSSFTVFHGSQIDGIDFPSPKQIDFNPVEQAEQLVAHLQEKTGIEVEIGGNRAAYSPQRDRIMMPSPDNFQSEEAYYGTLLHEYAHASGHASRMDRNLSTDRGSESYAIEELRAELTSCYLLGAVGLGSKKEIERSSNYIREWMDRIRMQPEIFVRAASEGQKSASFLLEGFDPKPALRPEEEKEAEKQDLFTEASEPEIPQAIMLKDPRIERNRVFGREELSYSYEDPRGFPIAERQPLFSSELEPLQQYFKAFPNASIEVAEFPIEGLNSFRSHDLEEHPSLAEIVRTPKIIPSLNVRDLGDLTRPGQGEMEL
jgi:antirestriction protein ArdC